MEGIIYEEYDVLEMSIENGSYKASNTTKKSNC